MSQLPQNYGGFLTEFLYQSGFSVTEVHIKRLGCDSLLLSEKHAQLGLVWVKATTG